LVTLCAQPLTSFHVNWDEDRDLFLLPIDQDGNGNHHSNMVHVHRSRYEKENLFLYAKTSKFIKERNTVSRGRAADDNNEIFPWKSCWTVFREKSFDWGMPHDPCVQ
jgi:hypothetical protein